MSYCMGKPRKGVKASSDALGMAWAPEQIAGQHEECREASADG